LAGVFSLTSVVALVLLLACCLPPSLAYDFTNVASVGAIATCGLRLPGSSQPDVNEARSNMTGDRITFVVGTAPVVQRRMVVYLGANSAPSALPQCFANITVDTASCQHFFTVSGTWRDLRNCGWTGPTPSAGGTVTFTNLFYIEYRDLFIDPGSRLVESRLTYPISLTFPDTVDMSFGNMTVIEESGVQNFTLTGLSFDSSGADRYLLLDFRMVSRYVA
jgi:hypothetical protein